MIDWAAVGAIGTGAGAFVRPQRRLPAYYLGRPAQVWIHAMSPRLAFTPTSTEAEARPTRTLSDVPFGA